ncbi:MAG: ribulose phosphate epimerase [Deltaproteobacteria bacterium]|nr:ribulose phosphate epimerase [Deltaproteobacteria bacterium]
MRRIHHIQAFWALALPAAMLLGGCPDGGKASGDDDSLTGDESTSGGQPEPTGTEPPPPDDGATDGMPGTGSETGIIFIDPIDDPIADCDVWAQDCPAGEKCMPWANDGSNIWNALQCVDVVDKPDQPGDECEVMGSGVSGLDTCDLGAMCWDVDNETNIGNCVAMCLGDQENAFCDEPDHTCVIANDGVLTLCLPECDPLIQTCAIGQGCFPINDSFTCAPDASGPTLGVYGDPCEAINACDAGLFCANAAVVPGCAGSAGCCSDFCDLDAPVPEDDCTGAPAGQECTPWYAEGEGPPDLQAVGACVLPAS